MFTTPIRYRGDPPLYKKREHSQKEGEQGGRKRKGSSAKEKDKGTFSRNGKKKHPWTVVKDGTKERKRKAKGGKGKKKKKVKEKREETQNKRTEGKKEAAVSS